MARSPIFLAKSGFKFWKNKFRGFALYTLFIGFLFVLQPFAPTSALDPWGFFVPQKILKMITALALIQLLSVFLASLFERRSGKLITGFLGGLISSTALTASLARESRNSSSEEMFLESLSFLAATGAMLAEAIALIFIGSDQPQLIYLFIFLGPVLTTIFLILKLYRKPFDSEHFSKEKSFPKIWVIIKLGFFITGILALSKLLQNIFGNTGLALLTLFVSFFEIHGSVIANVQLHEATAINSRFLGDLLAISLTASYLSKLFLIFTLGSQTFLKKTIHGTSFILGSLLLSWILFRLFL